MNTKYTLEIEFHDPDDNYHTKGEAKLQIPCESTDWDTAYFLAARLCKMLGGDDYMAYQDENS